MTAISAINGTSSTPAGTTTSLTNDPAAMQDRFLKLLVAQMNNQDPMNPMDNAQMTTQMAQINTVNGIQELNTTLKGMASQFTSMQVLQSASLVGHDVLVKSNALTPTGGVARGAFDLDGPADNVKVEILGPGGQILDSENMGSRQAGRHDFAWDASRYQGTDGISYRVTATYAGKPVSFTPLANAQVTSIGIDNGTMSVQLQDRSPVAYSDIKAIL